MRKLALILSLSFVVPLMTTTVVSAAENYSDLAIGDPLSRGHRRPKKRATPAAASTDAATPKADAAAPATPPAAEKAVEKAPAK